MSFRAGFSPRGTCCSERVAAGLGETYVKGCYQQLRSANIAAGKNVRAYTKDQTVEWFKALDQLPRDSDDAIHFDDAGLFFTHPEARCIDLEYPQKLERLPFFARYLSTLVYEEKDFRGAVLWFTEWGVWQASDEAAGYRIIECINRASGHPASFEVSPGHSFRADELSEAIGMLLQPMIFGWDAYYVPNWSYGFEEFFLHVRHDSFVTVVTRTKEFYDRVFQNLEKLELHPKPGHDRRITRFCRRS